MCFPDIYAFFKAIFLYSMWYTIAASSHGEDNFMPRLVTIEAIDHEEAENTAHSTLLF